MVRVISFAACLGIAMPSYADSLQIGDSVTVPVTVTVSSIAVIPELICAMPADQRPEGVECEVFVVEGD